MEINHEERLKTLAGNLASAVEHQSMPHLRACVQTLKDILATYPRESEIDAKWMSQLDARDRRTADIEAATAAERHRCLTIALDEVRYWKEVTDKHDLKSAGLREQVLDQIAIGAFGAASNIVAHIALPEARFAPRDAALSDAKESDNCVWQQTLELIATSHRYVYLNGHSTFVCVCGAKYSGGNAPDEWKKHILSLKPSTEGANP